MYDAVAREKYSNIRMAVLVVHTFQGLKNKTVHIHVPLGVPLGAFSLKKATVGTFAVAFRVSSRAKYDEKNTCCFRIGIS